MNLIISQELQLYLMTLFINKRKELMNKLFDSVDYNNSKFEYVSRNKDASFYEYMDSKEPFKAVRTSQIGFNGTKKKQNEFLNKLSNIKIGRKTLEQERTINNLERFYLSRQEVIFFLVTILKFYLMLVTNKNKMSLREMDLKY